MLERFFCHPRVLKRINESPHSHAIKKFVSFLGSRGHTRYVVQAYTQSVEHFFLWLEQQNQITLNCNSVRQYLSVHLLNCTCPPPAPCGLITNRTALNLLLRSADLPLKTMSSGDSERDRLIAEYDLHLLETAGLSEVTRRCRTRHAREILEKRFPSANRLQFDRMTPKDITDYVAERAVGLKPASIKTVTYSLRSLLRFLLKQDRRQERLLHAIPTIPQRKLSSIPRFMSEEELEQFLQYFDRSTSTGARDYAMALCMAELGIRVSEVAIMKLEDLDWRNGCIAIESEKTRCHRNLPLSKKLGKAISAYLQSDRPQPLCRNVFLRHSTPAGTAATRELVRGGMRRAYEKIGHPEWTGTHLLRHTAATRLHQRGVPLKEIADLLGHECIDTSMIYTKIHMSSLEQTALPWPEVRS